MNAEEERRERRNLERKEQHKMAKRMPKKMMRPTKYGGMVSAMDGVVDMVLIRINERRAEARRGSAAQKSNRSTIRVHFDQAE